jgi:hypothetical protein
MTTWAFHSTETGLAGLQGSTAGTWITALDAMLVNGVNSSSTGWSASWAGGTATFTKTGHGMPVGAAGIVLTVTGLSPAGYNVTNKTVTVVDANTITFPLADPSGTPATGTATVVRSPLGWAKSFSGTNLASYRPGTGQGNRFYLNVDDTNTVAQNAKFRGFEVATAAGPADANGTQPFPTAVQLTGGLFQYRSSTADATVRPWQMFSNGKIFYFFNQYSGLTTVGNGMCFGDITSYKNADAYHTIVIGDIASSATTTSIRIANAAATLAASSGHYIARSYTAVSGAVNVGKHLNSVFCNGATDIGAGGMTYPVGVEGGIMLSPIWISETTNGIRGHLPGLWAPCHNRPLSHGDTFSGVSGTPLEGKTFEVINVSAAGQLIVETSDTWDA